MASFFAHPALLIALLAIGLPVLIEWLFRRRKRQVELPTLRHLLRHKDQKKIKRQDRILLLLRTLACLLVVLAVARPILRSGLLGGQDQRKSRDDGVNGRPLM